jgi:hypothetical protein
VTLLSIAKAANCTRACFRRYFSIQLRCRLNNPEMRVAPALYLDLYGIGHGNARRQIVDIDNRPGPKIAASFGGLDNATGLVQTLPAREVRKIRVV